MDEQVRYLKESCGYQIDESVTVSKYDGSIYRKNGQPVPKIMTRGWCIKMRWNDSTTWVPMGLLNNADSPTGYKQIRYHLIFDVKIDLTCKTLFVAGGHITAPPPLHQ